MSSATVTRVRSYLDQLDRALRDLPRDRRLEIVRDIQWHIDGAIAALEEPSGAAIEQILDGLGTPEDIARAAYEEQPPVRARMATRDLAAVILLLVGGLVLPLVGWVIGVVLLWSSTAWRTKDKLIGTLLVPGGLLTTLLFFGVGVFAVSSTSECSSTSPATASPAMHCTTSGPGWGAHALLLVLGIVSVVGPFFSMVWLIRTARRD
jgi:uncharacterized membrane protein